MVRAFWKATGLLCAFLFAMEPDTSAADAELPKVVPTVDPALAQTYSCGPLQGRLLAAKNGVRAYLIEGNGVGGAPQIMVQASGSCHLTLPHGELDILSGAGEYFNWAAPPEERPVARPSFYGFVRRLVEERTNAAKRSCQGLDSTKVIQAYRATRFALCVERRTNAALRSTMIVSIDETTASYSANYQVWIYNGRIVGVGRMAGDLDGNSTYSEASFDGQ